MKLIIAGGRDYQFNVSDYAKLNEIFGEHELTEVVSGGATGADKCGEIWANFIGLPIKRFPANWKSHGKAAGPLRNKEMAKYADALVTFSGGRGTANMIKQANEHGLKILNNS